MSAKKNTRAVGAAVAVSGLLVGAMVMNSTGAAFTAKTDNTNNSFYTGQVALSDNDLGRAMFNTASPTFAGGPDGVLDGGTTLTRCLTVTVGGNLYGPGYDVNLYTANVGQGRVNGNPIGVGDLSPFLGTTINVKPLTGGETVGPDCSGYSAATGTETTAFQGSLATLGSTKTDFANSVNILTGTALNARAVVKIDVVVGDGDPDAVFGSPNSAQGKAAQADFIFQEKKVR